MQERKVGRKEIGLSAFLCGVVMLLFCVLSTGQFDQACALVAGDGYELYVPAAVSFFRNLLSGQGITYSWDLSFGMNAIGYYASYGGGSPFHLLFLLYPMVSAETIVLWVLVGKAAVIGAAFTWFCKRVWKMEGILPAVFSMFYALCGFQVSVNVMNYLWMDAVYLLPLLLTLIVIFLEEGKWKCLVFGYAYLFLCHFYMGYMVGFFTAFFFLGYFFLYCKKRQNSPMLVLFLKYAGIVLLAAGLLAFILVPSAIQILTMTPPDATGEEVLQKNPLRLLSQFLYGIEWNSDSKLPFVYSGMPVLMLLPVFFGSRKILWKEKALYGGMWVLMLLSTLFLPLYTFWHGFDIPDGWYHRFAFMISFLSVAMACRSASVLCGSSQEEDQETTAMESQEEERQAAAMESQEEEPQAAAMESQGEEPQATAMESQGEEPQCENRAESNGKSSPLLLSLPVAIYGLVCLGAITGLGLLFEDTVGQGIWKWNALLAVLWFLAYMAVKKVQQKQAVIASLLLIFLVGAEVLGNGLREHKIYQSLTERNIWSMEMQGAVEALQADQGFYRVQADNSLLINADTLWGYRGVSDFGTLENYKVREALSNMGAYTSPRVVTGYGSNPFTQMIGNVKYAVTASGSKDGAEAGASLGMYPRFLNLGFMVDGGVADFSFQSDNVFDNCNNLASAMTGSPVEVFSVIPAEQVRIEENGITLGKSDDWYYLQGDSEADGTLLITYSVPYVGQDAYAMFSAHNVGIKMDRPQFYEYFNTRDFGYFGVKYSNRMEVIDDQMVCPIVMQNGLTRDYVTYKYASFAYVDEQALEECYQILGLHQMEIADFKNGKIAGSVEVTDASQILFTSIPYEEGWKISSPNGEVEKLSLLDGAFLGLRFPAEGHYDLVWNYVAPGSTAGCLITGISVLLLAAVVWMERRKERVN